MGLDEDRAGRRPGLACGVCRWIADRLGRTVAAREPADRGSRQRRLERRLRDLEIRLGRERRWDDILGRPA